MRILILGLLLVSPVLGQSSATYRVTFDATWSAATHPAGFPANPHFSGLVGATHSAGVSFWAVSTLASAGMEAMAERGVKTDLLAEVSAAGTAVGTPLSGGGIGLSPGRVDMVFDIDSNRPLVTLVSMLAPSPDWFVGVSGLDLADGGAWRPRVEVSLDVHDAGTDSGTDYTSPDADTQPREVVRLLADGPFAGVSRVGTMTFELVSTTGREREAPALSLPGAPWPNPASHVVHVAVDGPYTDVTVHDLLGRAVRTGKATGGKAVFDVADLPPGLYLVRAGSGARAFVIAR